MDIDKLSNTDASGGEWFYPDIGDNLSRPKEQRAGLWCQRMDGRELEKAEVGLLRRVKSTNQRTALRQAGELMAKRKEALVRKRVTKLQNWFDGAADGGRKAVEAIGDLLDLLMARPGCGAIAVKLVNDTYEFIIGASQIEEELLGESDSPLDSP